MKIFAGLVLLISFCAGIFAGILCLAAGQAESRAEEQRDREEKRKETE